MRRWICFVLLIFVCQCASSRRNGAKQEGLIPVTFHYRDGEAQKVCVVGSFNGWSSRAHCMTKEGDTWVMRLPLPRGHHTYLFLVDDQWSRTDPGNGLTEESGFGTSNSVLVLE